MSSFFHDGRITRRKNILVRSSLQRLNLCFLINCSFCDDRDIRILFLLFHLMDHFKSIHHRHTKIKKNNMYLLLFQLFHRLFSVFCLQNLIFIFKDFCKRNAFHFHVIYNEHCQLSVHI